MKKSIFILALLIGGNTLIAQNLTMGQILEIKKKTAIENWRKVRTYSTKTTHKMITYAIAIMLNQFNGQLVGLCRFCLVSAIPEQDIHQL